MIKVLWLQGLGCGGETVSLLNAEQPDLLTTFSVIGVDLVWHPAFTRIQGAAARKLLQDCEKGRKKLDILVVEGALPRTSRPMPRAFGPEEPPLSEQVRKLAGVARYVMAAGTCAAFGGVMAASLAGQQAGADSSRATGLQFLRQHRGGLLPPEFRSAAGMPVINVPGCPAHPDWLTGTLTELASDSLRESDLDRYARPKMFYSKLAHHGCPRNEYYEFKASAQEYSHQGCLFENLGCKATQCDSDCNERLWLARTGSCPRGGFPCLSCTSPKFPDGFMPFFETQKIGGIPTTLPLDVPKAWYVGMSGLAKLACPPRLAANAVSFKPVPVFDRATPGSQASGERDSLGGTANPASAGRLEEPDGKA